MSMVRASTEVPVGRTLSRFIIQLGISPRCRGSKGLASTGLGTANTGFTAAKAVGLGSKKGVAFRPADARLA